MQRIDRASVGYPKDDKRVRQFFLDTIARAVRLSHAGLITVEGYVVQDLAPELTLLLSVEYRCWTADAAETNCPVE
jgi:hypothetical protein